MDSLLRLNMQYLALCLTENVAVLYMMTIVFSAVQQKIIWR